MVGLDKLTIARVMKEFPRFKKPKTPLPCPKQLETGPYRGLDKSTSRITPDLLLWN